MGKGNPANLTVKTNLAAEELKQQLGGCLGRVTSNQPEDWSEDNPFYGHCAVIALIVQDRLGGRLMRTTVHGTSHYLNQLEDGQLIDLSFEQFPAGATYDHEPQPRPREPVISYPGTRERYQEVLGKLNKLNL